MASLLRNLLAWVRRDFRWYLLIFPVLSVAVAYKLSAANFLDWGDSSVFKPVMEIVHPALLSGFLCLSLLRLMQSRNASFTFLAVLSAFTLSRESLGGLFLLLTPVVIRRPQSPKAAQADREPNVEPKV
jgi:hypothetical protein